MNGWKGKILRVDLTTSTTTVEDLDRAVAEQYIGCLGLGTRYLCDEVDPTVDPLGPENKLFIPTGPLTGTGAPGANRYMVVTKSPLTGGVANSSSAGEFATALKYAGFDMAIFEGVAERPVYPQDLLGSMYQLMGIDPEGPLPNPRGLDLPLTLASKGKGRLTEIM